MHTTRRTVLATAALAATTIAAPYVKRAYGAGRLSAGFWDHWVPGANDVCTRLCQEWAKRENVDVQIDFITSQGFKNQLTEAMEAQAKSGHDILSFQTWDVAGYAEELEPVDDLMQELVARNGPVDPTVEYLARPEGRWVAVPQTPGSQLKPPCSRIDYLKQMAGIDIVAMYPAGAPMNKELADKWTWETFLVAAQKCHAGGKPFGLGLGVTADCLDWTGALLHSYGAELIDKDGNIAVDSESTRAALDYVKRLVPFLPPDVFAWDDASNNRWLISGNGALIMNPPSAWAVAKRDAPQVAEQLWTHGMPKGPAGRFAPYNGFFWGIWGFSPHKSAAKSLLAHLSTRESVERFVEASQGYDLPSYASFLDFKTWDEQGPPKGTLSHYGHPDDQKRSVAISPAPPRIAMQAYNQATSTKMIARMAQGGESPDQAIAWASRELEGFLRT